MVNRNKKAVALISGGLDSMLAARLVKNQGIYVEGLNFFTGFVSRATLMQFEKIKKVGEITPFG